MFDSEIPSAPVPIATPTRIVVCIAIPASGALQWHRSVAQALRSIRGVTLRSITAATRSETNNPWRILVQQTPALLPAAFIDIAPAIKPSDDIRSAVAQCDALIDLTGALPADVTCRRGVWRLFDERDQCLMRAFPGIDAMTAGRGGHLRLLQLIGAETVLLREARFTLESDYEKSFDRYYAMATVLLRQALIDVTLAVVRDAAPYALSDRPPPSPVTIRFQLLRGKCAALRSKLKGMVLSESWMIGIIDHPIHHVLDASTPLAIRWPGRREESHYLADPFGIPGSAERILCEELDWKTGVGHISEVTLSGDEIGRRAKVDFALDGHLSFPFMFVDRGQTYCIVESCAARRCALFIDDQQHGWRSIAILLDQVAAADPVIFCWEDRYWLAYTDNDQSPFDNLCLCFADKLDGPWTPHPGNPVKIDNRSARSAGTPFLHEGALYRPAQDCSLTYGGATTINRVTVCSPTDFREEAVRVLSPDRSGRNPHGLHTVSAWGDRTLVDGKRYVVNVGVIMGKFARRWSALRGRFAGGIH